MATLTPNEVLVLLDLWMFESPTELIPSPAQIAQVRSVLRTRPDATDQAIAEAISACTRYLEPRDPEGMKF